MGVKRLASSIPAAMAAAVVVITNCVIAASSIPFAATLGWIPTTVKG